MRVSRFEELVVYEAAPPHSPHYYPTIKLLGTERAQQWSWLDLLDLHRYVWIHRAEVLYPGGEDVAARGERAAKPDAPAHLTSLGD